MGSLNLNLNSMKKIGLTIARWAVGILFLFSGIAKGIDPVGFEYKLSDYIDALQLKILDILVTPGAFLLPFAEFLIGITLLTGILIRISTKVALGFMLIFTPLTLYIALKNPVTDCGCFGDALVITNWETFYKNVVLIILVVLLLLNRKSLGFLISLTFRKIIFLIVLISYILVVSWSLRHEPILDFRPYKIGVNIPEGMTIPQGAPTDVYQNSYLYKNKFSKEVKKFGDHDFPWQDTLHWKFESMDRPLLVKKGYRPPIHDFSIQTIDQQNVTDNYLHDSIHTFFVITYDLEKSSHEKQKELNLLANWAKQKGFRFIGLTSTSGEGLRNYQLEQKPTYDILFTDQTTLKTIIRSNPGLILLRKGTILGKWAEADFPSPSKAEAYINAQTTNLK